MPNNLVSHAAAIHQSTTPSAGTMHIECIPMSGSVVAQPAAGSTPPPQQIRVVQAAQAQPRVVQHSGGQHYQLIQQQPSQQQHQGNAAGLTLIQTATGQLLLQQPHQVTVI